MNIEKTFSVLYRIDAPTAAAALDIARHIAIEQTIEFPPDLVPRRAILDTIVGVVAPEQREDGKHRFWITYNENTAGTDITQLFNVIFGNSSMQPGIWVEDLRFSEAFLEAYKGPRFGCEGIRKRLHVPVRPLLHCVIKPVGSTTQELAHMAYCFAKGGADLIKDDHGITNQRSAVFSERVAACAQAVAKANKETGGHSLYIANCTADGSATHERARLAKRLGAGGVLLAPALTGFGMVREIAADPEVDIPIISHPAFAGTFFMPGLSGIVMSVLYGIFSRLAGADAVVFPSFGGRFTFTAADCRLIVKRALMPFSHLKPIFPSPGGGITEDTIPNLIDIYGKNVMFLIGGGIFRHGPDLIENTAYYRKLIEGLYA